MLWHLLLAGSLSYLNPATDMDWETTMPTQPAHMQWVTFPNLVPPQPLTRVTSLPAGEAIALDFVTESPHHQQIKMPVNGTFEVRVEAGQHFAILDNDATDGVARIQMPTQIMDIYLRPLNSQQTPKKQALTFEEPLYYIQQDLIPFDQAHGYQLAGRPIPVPLDWQSVQGQNHVWRLTNSGVPRLQTRWVVAQQKTMPPGVQEIGPAGGLVSLPHIAELDIPAGALSQQTVIVMRQKHEVIKYSGEIDVATPIELLPEGLQFNKHALIRLRIDSVKIKGFTPESVYYYSFDNNQESALRHGEMLELTIEKSKYTDVTSFEDWRKIHHFSYVRALVLESLYSEDYIF